MKRLIAYIMVFAMILSVMPAVVSAADTSDLSSRLLAEYNFDNQTTNDAVGSNNATFYNNATATAANYVDGVSGKALKLSTQGTEEKYWLSVPYSAFGSNTDSFTISLWYNSTGHNTSGENSELFSLYNSSAEKFLFYGAMTDGSSTAFTMKWDGTYGFANVIGGYKENKWEHLVFAVDASDGQSKITTYINGQQASVDQGGAWANSLMSQLGIDTFTIGGKNPYKGGATPNCLFYGSVDEVQLYAGALNADEVAQIYNAVSKDDSEKPSEDEQLKILAIGNSFSIDATTYLWEIMNDGGMTDHTVGVAYIGNSTLDQHWGNIQNDATAYEYWKNDSGSWSIAASKTLLEILTAEQWDIITVQQHSPQAGQADAFTNLEGILDFIDANKTNGDAKVYWHMTWAYPSANTDANFLNWYNQDQIIMYNAITTVTQELILPNDRFSGIIPAGTAIQNLRTSYLGDTLCRDTVHLSNDHGRYTAGMLWYAYLLGGDVTQIDWTPTAYGYVANDLPAIREAVTEALAAPFTVSSCGAARTGDAVQAGDLIGQWNFDDSNTEDSVGNYHATLYNNGSGITGTYVDGVSGKALQLSEQGTEQKYWLDIPYAVFGNYRDSFTISLWYNSAGHNTSGENSELFSLYNKSGERFLFYGAQYDGNPNAFTMKWDGTYGFANVFGGYKENEWVHLVFAVDAVDGQSKITAYVNGEAVGVEQGGAWANSLMSQLGVSAFTIGGKNPYKGGTTPNCLFYGKVDEVRLYAGALDADAAKAIYDEVAVVPTERGDLLAEYNFDNENTNDSVGVNHATFYNNADTAAAGYVDGVSGKALKLSTQGTDEKYWLSVPYSAFGSNTDSFTISLWYNSTGHNTSGENSELFSLYNSSAEKFLFYGAPYDNSANAFTMKWDGTYGFANVIGGYKENEWVHLVFVVDVVDGQSKITAYVNGTAMEIEQGGEWANSLMSQLGINTFTIGGKNPYKGGATPNCLFYGSVDEVQIYAGALNATEAAAIYNAIANPPAERGDLLAEYNFDNETTNDSKGIHNATFYNNATATAANYVDGISGKALKLSTQGTDEKYWLSVPYSAFGSNTDSFTISLWYNSTGHNTSGENSELFSLYNSSAEKFLFYGAPYDNSANAFTMKWDGTYGFANVIGGYKENEWVHLVFVVDVVDGQSKITAYVNGTAMEIEQGGEWANSLMSQLGINTFTIGGKNPYKGGATPNCLFYGSVDEVQIYAGALTAEEARAIYGKNAGAEAADGMGSVSYLQTTLSDGINLSLYTTVTSQLIADPDAYAKITVDGEEKTVSLKNATTKIIGTNTYFVFTANVAAAQMTEEITLQLFNGAGEGGDVYTCSVQGYAQTLLASQEYADCHDLVKNLLNYGAKAQTYFNVNTDKLANAGNEIQVTNAVPAESVAIELEGTVSGISFYGATLLFKDKIAVRYYFTAENGVEGLTFQINGKDCQPFEKGGKYYVEIGGINPQQYSQVITATVSDGTDTLSINYSPMNYIVRMYNGAASANLKALLEAMYNYHLKAVAYAA